jgi:cytochrome c551
MLQTLVKIAQPVTAAACLAFVVLLFFQKDDPTEVQSGPAAAFPDEAASAIDACEKVRTAGNSAAQCPAGATPTTAPAGEAEEQTTTTEAGIDGAAVFADNCATCHGDDGGGGIGPNLQGVGNRDFVVTMVTNGGGGMPSFEGQLDDDEIEAVADYVTNEL